MWLLSERVDAEMQRMEAAGGMPSAEQQCAYEEAQDVGLSADGPRNMTIVDGIAEIAVEGVLTRKPDLFARWFGGGNTTYSDIQRGLAVAATDPAVKRLSFFFDTPGGAADGLFDTVEAIQTFKATGKPITVRARRAESAGYVLAASAGKITALNKVAEFGSVGVVASFLQRDDVVTLTNSESPDKRPDLTTEKGKKVVIKYLDSIYKWAAEAIASGRDTTVSSVNEDFGRGATLLASDAKRRGMIDAIAKPALRAVKPTAQAGGQHQETSKMDIATLKKEHPDVYAAAFDDGVKTERGRVCAHLKMGETCHASATATKAIREGIDFSAESQAEYLSALADHGDRSKREAEGAEANKTLEGTGGQTVEDADKLEEEVLKELQRLQGIEETA